VLRRRRLEPAVRAAYPSSLPAEVGRDPLGAATRVREVAGVWARAGVQEDATRATGAFIGLTAVVLAVATVGAVVEPEWVVRTAPAWLLAAGNAVLTAAVAGLLWVGRQTSRDRTFRRTVGILWDVGTFWPRATHPLAPPSYGERTVPDLLRRTEALTGTDLPPQRRAGTHTVVLSCHSQGSVIGAATVAASTYATLARTALLTYGSPLRRLYARFFPAYFDGPQLERLGALLAHPTRADRSAWPWVNLHRPSDPVGGALFVPRAAVEGDGGDDLDRALVDPPFARPRGDGSWPEPLGHSDYPRDPAFDRALDDLVRRRG
jgi:hypothetical protein